MKPSNQVQVAPAGKCEVRRAQASICVANPAALAETWRRADLMGRFVGQDVWANIWCAALADMEAVVAMVTLACPGGAAVALVAMWGWIIPSGLFFRATSAGYLPLSCLITVPDVRCRRQLEALRFAAPAHTLASCGLVGGGHEASCLSLCGAGCCASTML